MIKTCSRRGKPCQLDTVLCCSYTSSIVRELKTTGNDTVDGAADAPETAESQSLKDRLILLERQVGYCRQLMSVTE
jgi:hypothetical protein